MRALLFLPLIATAQAWDAAGHMLVGQVAWEKMTPAARATASELVSLIDGKFNHGNPYNFVTIGCWMDDLRALPKKDYPWSAWHYIDAEKTADGSAFTLPAPPHIVSAIAENLATLKDAAAPREKRAQALGQLVHWVGDIHQPLHATTWMKDRGGNGYLIYGIPFSDLMLNQPSNLHTYWDKAFRFTAAEGKTVEAWKAPAQRPEAPGEGIIAERAKEMIAAFPDPEELKLPANAEAWAKESHIIGCTKAYPPGEHTTDTEVRKLEPDWVQASQGVAQRRIVIAGNRLATMLNELLK